MTEEYIALDLETTGLRSDRDRILEIGAARVKCGKVVESYSTLVDCRMRIPAHITALTGINDQMSATGIPTDRAVKEFLDFSGGLPLLGHNILFDYSFVKHQAVNQGLPFDRMGIDTLKIAKKFLSDLPARKLTALCAYYKIDAGRSHRALDDAIAASTLYQRLVEDFFEVSPAAFSPEEMLCKVKKQNLITKFQKAYLIDLIKYHRIEVDVTIESLSKSGASRMIDQIISQNGRIKR